MSGRRGGKVFLLTKMKPERAIGTLAAEAKAKVSHAGRQPSGSAGARTQ
jgi:hypothetical protein